MPKVSKEHQEARREEILGAALRCFRRAGYHESSMQEICREAQLSPGAVYGYFESKQEILRAVASRDRERTRRMIRGLATGRDSRAALREFVIAFLKDAKSVQEMGHSFELYSIAGRDREMEQILRENNAVVLEELSALLGGTKPTRDHRRQAQAVYGTLLGLSALALTGNLDKKLLGPTLDAVLGSEGSAG